MEYCFEHVVLSRLLRQKLDHLDPLQLAYKRNRGADDATLSLLLKTYPHLEKTPPHSFVRILFFDFSSAFKTIQPHLMSRKFTTLALSPRLILWIIVFLVNRPQFVRSNDVSSVGYPSAGAPQGTVLSPVLFTVYTDDCRGSEECPVVKCSDDTAITDLSNSHKSFTDSVYRFSEWCSDNHLDLNVLKTKEMIIDFRRNSAVLPKLSINGTEVDRVEEYNYLGTDNKLEFTANTNFI